MKAAIAMNFKVMIGCTNFLICLICVDLVWFCAGLRDFPPFFVVLVDHFPKFNSVFSDFTSVLATFRHKNPCYTSIIAQIIQNVNAFYALRQGVSFAGRKTFAGERAIIPALLREGEDFDKLGCGVDGAMSIDARRLAKLPQAITE